MSTSYDDTLHVPDRTWSRQEARELLEGLPYELETQWVHLDCQGAFVATPSFLDEMVKIILVERGAQRLVLLRAPDRTLELAMKAAEARGVADRFGVQG